jgi:hypothetical protein
MTGGSGWILPDVARHLSVQTIRAGEILYRAHHVSRHPIWFGPAPGEAPRYRYDSHDGSYRVCYLGLSERSAFVEGVLHRAIPRRIIAEKTLLDRAIADVRVIEDIRAARLYGEHLIPTGATAEVAHGESYETVSWPWSRGLFDHADQVDGIVYSARHDDSQLALALFDRAEHKIEAGESHPLSAKDMRTLRLLDLYRLGLEPFG